FAIHFAFGPHLIGIVRPGVRIEATPTRFAIGVGAFANVHGIGFQDAFIARTVLVRHPRTNERSSAADTLGIDFCFVLADAGLRESSDNAAGRAAGKGSGCRGSEPTRGHYGTNSRDRHDAKPGEESRRAA